LIQPGIVVRHEMALRNLLVTAVRELSPGFVRITLGGPELAGFASAGPADHSKLFFPDPATGSIAAPRLVEGRMQRPESGTVMVRDYTPREFRDGTVPELDFDFFIHGEGPASSWAANAVVGDPMVIAGPRGSRMPPEGLSRVILAADETALPALARWIESLPDEVEIVAFATVSNESDAAYLEPSHVNRARLVWIDKQQDALERAFRAYGPISDDTYVWAAGEAASLIPIRRYLRRELGLTAAQVKVDGYWKLGEAGRDHHAPVDPSDPED
jgi:NADPH-dependent ferric siderophore reductase